MAAIPVPSVNTPTYQSWGRPWRTGRTPSTTSDSTQTTDVGGNCHILNTTWQGTVGAAANAFTLSVMASGVWLRHYMQLSSGLGHRRHRIQQRRSVAAVCQCLGHRVDRDV